MQNSSSMTFARPTSRPRSGGAFDPPELVDERPGFLSVLFTGQGAKHLFRDEGGGHRFQRIPPTEKRGRIQTSTVTVAVLDPDATTRYRLNESDVDIQTTRGSGPGGQHRNKVESCVVATHRPSGISVRVDMRSQHQSRSIALQILAAKLAEAETNKAQSERDHTRRAQVGTGMRGDKIRTYRTQDDRVTDHRSNRTWSLKSWLRGNWD